MSKDKKKSDKEKLPTDEELLRLAIDGEEDELYTASSTDVEATMKIKRAKEECDELIDEDKDKDKDDSE